MPAARPRREYRPECAGTSISARRPRRSLDLLSPANRRIEKIAERGDRLVGAIRPAQIALQRLGFRKRVFEFADGRERLCVGYVTSGRASAQKGRDEGTALPRFVAGTSRSTVSRAGTSLYYIPRIFRALAFKTLGRIPSRIS